MSYTFSTGVLLPLYVCTEKQMQMTQWANSLQLKFFIFHINGLILPKLSQGNYLQILFFLFAFPYVPRFILTA